MQMSDHQNQMIKKPSTAFTLQKVSLGPRDDIYLGLKIKVNALKQLEAWINLLPSLKVWGFKIENSQLANIAPQDVLRTSPSTFPGRPLKIPFHRPNLTSWGSPKMTSMGRLNLTFKARPWEIDQGLPQDVLRTSPRGP